MDSMFRSVVEQKVKEKGIRIISTDPSIRALIKQTELLIDRDAVKATYFDAEGAILCSVQTEKGKNPPRIGSVTEIRPQARYLSNYQKEKLKIYKFKCNKEKDKDIIEWLDRVSNIQATVKQLIRNAIKQETERNNEETKG